MDESGHLFQTETDLIAAEVRKRKAERTKHLGNPLDLPAKPLDVLLRDNELWIAQSNALVRRINLESDATLQVYKGHTAPVTSIALIEKSGDENSGLLLVSGSWDKTVKIWDAQNKSLISSTQAHSDFVKCVFPVSELQLLITSGSDKVVRLWDLSSLRQKDPLKMIGTMSAHTRPVQCFAVNVQSASAATLYTADSMGIIKVWELERTYGDAPSCRATEREELIIHRTGINDIWFGQNQLWTASTDDTVLLTERPASSTPAPNPAKPVPAITHPTAVKAILPLAPTPLGEPYLLTAAGDILRLYDVSDPGAPELLSTTDAHWLDITALRLWFRRIVAEDGKVSVEPWIISASLDLTVRRWKLADLISPPKEQPKREKEAAPKTTPGPQLTAEEEAELAELMSDDE